MFTIGVCGIILNRKNIIVILMSVEFMLLSVNINLVAFSAYHSDLTGQVFASVHSHGRGGGSRHRPCDSGRLLPQSRVDRGRRHQRFEGLIAIMYNTIVFAPLFGFFAAAVLGKYVSARVSEVVTTALLFVSCILSWIVFVNVGLGHGQASAPVIGNWFTSGGLKVDWVLRVDSLTAVMLVVVTSVSSLVHLYSIGYMHEDPSRPRFFGYLSLFTFAMLMLVTADNLVQMYFGWEGVGLASYLLIGFWYQKPSANAAAIKAFVVNRVGDFGFALGIFLTCSDADAGAVSFATYFRRRAGPGQQVRSCVRHGCRRLTIICLLLFMGAMGKSAQFLLHTWLPDAMEGPTPVSALIHAATMVTAGVFMVARLSPLFELSPAALAPSSRSSALQQPFSRRRRSGAERHQARHRLFDLFAAWLHVRRVCGVGAYALGIFHLFTHAFFKALLFLGAGSVIHAMHHEQDMRNMGGLRRTHPVHLLDDDASARWR
jgi:NADH-quinone oxidoreductase subunit L